MSGKSIVYDNTYVRKIIGLYLDLKMSDVKFVFDIETDQPQVNLVHRAILSLDNTTFDANYGSVKEGGDIPIADACSAVFKEFLQFFYFDQVRLTPENIGQVINLCKKYEMNECMRACETALQKSLTINDMCLGYSIALLFKQKKLVEFCEQEIIRNAPEIIKSVSFLSGGRNLVEKILILVSSKWSALETVIACMEWSKAECKRNNLYTNPKNLRTQLRGIFSRIPFEKLTLEQFTHHFITYNGFFDSNEIVAINKKILFQNQQSKSFNLELLVVDRPRKTLSLGHVLDCDRREPGTFIYGIGWNHSRTEFTSNKQLLLTKFYVPDINGSEMEFGICQKGLIPKSTPFTYRKQYIYLHKPLIIKAVKTYVIAIKYFKKCNVVITKYKKIVQLEHDITIEFSTRSHDLVSRLIFEIPEN